MLDVAAVVAQVHGLSEERLMVWVEEGLVRPVRQEGVLAFAEVDVARLRLLVTLESDLEVERDTVPMVVDLLDQIHGLRRALRTLGEAVARQPAAVRVDIRAPVVARQRTDGSPVDVEDEG
jgi:chaperone modulatory protein CbpM